MIGESKLFRESSIWVIGRLVQINFNVRYKNKYKIYRNINYNIYLFFGYYLLLGIKAF